MSMLERFKAGMTRCQSRAISMTTGLTGSNEGEAVGIRSQPALFIAARMENLQRLELQTERIDLGLGRLDVAYH